MKKLYHEVISGVTKLKSLIFLKEKAMILMAGMLMKTAQVKK